MTKPLRYSCQRERIYEYWAALEGHLSVGMIYTALCRELPDLSPGTVCRNLKLPEEMGKIRKATAYQSNYRYDAICEDHIHFICQECGTIIDVFDVDTKIFSQIISLSAGYQPSRPDLIITGRCPKCWQHNSILTNDKIYHLTRHIPLP